MASFLVQSILRAAPRPGLFLVGEIKSGTIRAGMVARIRVDGALYTEAPVAGVDFVHRPGGESQVALHVATDDPKDDDLIEALCGDGDTIEVVEPSGDQGARGKPSERD